MLVVVRFVADAVAAFGHLHAESHGVEDESVVGGGGGSQVGDDVVHFTDLSAPFVVVGKWVHGVLLTWL